MAIVDTKRLQPCRPFCGKDSNFTFTRTKLINIGSKSRCLVFRQKDNKGTRKKHYGNYSFMQSLAGNLLFPCYDLSSFFLFANTVSISVFSLFFWAKKCVIVQSHVAYLGINCLCFFKRCKYLNWAHGKSAFHFFS